MEEIKLWKIVSESGDKPKATPVGKETTTELLLEEVLTATPDLLMPDLSLIGRQTETPSGLLDLLGVDGDGRLVVFELKKGSLRRDAVAQAIDYASYLDGLRPEDLCALIKKNPGGGGVEHIEDFDQWYQENCDSQLADIGKPRIVLVGLGVDEGAKRMVEFLAGTGLDISLITFQGFKQDDDLLLARQVEVQSSVPPGEDKKRDNQLILNKRLKQLGIEQNYAALIAAIKQGLGESVQFPNQSGYTFYLLELSATGRLVRRAYIGLSGTGSDRQASNCVAEPCHQCCGGEVQRRASCDGYGIDFFIQGQLGRRHLDRWSRACCEVRRGFEGSHSGYRGWMEG